MENNQTTNASVEVVDEIERRFLVKADLYHEAIMSAHLGDTIIDEYGIDQTYIVLSPDVVKRVRFDSRKKDRAIVTEKRKRSAMTNQETNEYISASIGRTMVLSQQVPGTVTVVKWRTVLPHDGKVKWEIDTFYEDNVGLRIAEIEVPSEDYDLGTLPDWIGREITGEAKYSNAMLAKNPYRKWWSVRIRRAFNIFK